MGDTPTRKEDSGKHIFDDIAEAILTRTAAAGGSVDSIKAVGIDIPGTIWEDGYLELSVNVGLKGCLPDGKELSRRLNHVPVACGNDGEYRGAWRILEGRRRRTPQYGADYTGNRCRRRHCPGWQGDRRCARNRRRDRSSAGSVRGAGSMQLRKPRLPGASFQCDRHWRA